MRALDVARFNPDGSLDITFGQNGIALSPLPSGESADGSIKLLVQPDGKIVVAGLVSDGNGGENLAMVRYTAGGLLDNYANDPSAAFGDLDSLSNEPTGIVTVSLGAVPDVFDTALQPGDRIIVAVPDSGTGGTDLRDYDPAGQLAATVSDSRAADHPLLAVEPDGDVLLAESASGGFTVRQYDGDALSADSSFGTATGPFAAARALAVQPDGKIVAAGVDAVLGSDYWALARLNPDGTADLGFGGGTTNEILSSIGGGPAAMAVQPDGKILVAGSSPDSRTSATDAYFARYASGGLGVAVSEPDVSPQSLALTFNGSPIGTSPIAYSGGDAMDGGSAAGVEIHGSFTDPGTVQEPHVVTIQWGDDSTPATIDLDASQTSFDYPLRQYAAPGTYTVSVTVANLDGSGPCTASFTVDYTQSQPAGSRLESRSIDNHCRRPGEPERLVHRSAIERRAHGHHRLGRRDGKLAGRDDVES